MEMLLNVASPLTAEIVKVPDNVPLAGSLLMANVMESVAVGTRLPPASCTWTLMAGEMDVVDTVFVGSTLYTNWVAAPTVMLKPAEVANVSPEAVPSRV